MHKTKTQQPLTQGENPSLRIVVAEDNVVNQALARMMLCRAGHEVHCVGNGLELLQTLQENPYDLILLDMRMPCMDGVEAASCIRSGHKDIDPAIPINAMTAMADSASVESFRASGVEEILFKPITWEALKTVIQRVLQSASLANADQQ